MLHRYQLEALHSARTAKEGIAAQLDIAREQLYATPEYAAVKRLEIELHAQDDQINVQRKIVVDAALDDYRAFNNKHPLPGVDIRVNTKVVYDLQVARNWALSNLTTAIALDVKTFDAAMIQLSKANAMTVPGFVSFREEPTAAIATDLTKVLEPKSYQDAVDAIVYALKPNSSPEG